MLLIWNQPHHIMHLNVVQDRSVQLQLNQVLQRCVFILVMFKPKGLNCMEYPVSFTLQCSSYFADYIYLYHLYPSTLESLILNKISVKHKTNNRLRTDQGGGALLNEQWFCGTLCSWIIHFQIKSHQHVCKSEAWCVSKLICITLTFLTATLSNNMVMYCF